MKIYPITAALILTACDPGVDLEGLDTTGDPQPPPALDSTGGDDPEDPRRTPDEADSTGGQWALDSTGGEACPFPALGTWCRSQLAIAIDLPCSEAPDQQDCLDTIVALWSDGDADLLAELDCDPSGPRCQAAYQVCAGVGPATCLLHDTQDCAALALEADVSLERSAWTCGRIADLY